jgi:DNA repair exonuclease SbcCD ATPase subunit
LDRRSLVVIAASLLLSGAGCVVTSSSYEVKAREADALREALGSLNREKTRLTQENEALSKQLASCKEADAALSSRIAELEGSLERLGEGTAGSPGTPPGPSASRGRFVDELLEREKETGRKMQELSAQAEKCERELERMRRGNAAGSR